MVLTYHQFSFNTTPFVLDLLDRASLSNLPLAKIVLVLHSLPYFHTYPVKT